MNRDEFKRLIASAATAPEVLADVQDAAESLFAEIDEQASNIQTLKEENSNLVKRQGALLLRVLGNEPAETEDDDAEPTHEELLSLFSEAIKK